MRERDRAFGWLARYLSLALTLPASVAAGFIMGAFAAKWTGMPILEAAGILLGMAAGLMQIFRELGRDSKVKPR